MTRLRHWWNAHLGPTALLTLNKEHATVRQALGELLSKFEPTEQEVEEAGQLLRDLEHLMRHKSDDHHT